MSEPFELFNEKLLADNIQIISWSPTADLVLLVSRENTISLYRKREEVNKVWSLENTAWSEIKIVTWKPNGSYFLRRHPFFFARKKKVTTFLFSM